METPRDFLKATKSPGPAVDLTYEPSSSSARTVAMDAAMIDSFKREEYTPFPEQILSQAGSRESLIRSRTSLLRRDELLDEEFENESATSDESDSSAVLRDSQLNTSAPTKTKKSGTRQYRSRYDDFTTIDWVHDFALDRRRQKRLKRTSARLPSWISPGSLLYKRFSGHLADPIVYGRLKWVFGKLNTYWEAGQGWILITVIGILIGLTSSWIEVASSWLSDIKQGVCRLPGPDGSITGWYLNRRFCCWETTYQECTWWHPWFQFSLFNFFVYTVFALLYCSAAYILVQLLAPYAASSGLPEVRTILGGFVIHRFLGIWTGIVKSVAVVLAVASGLTLGKEVPLVHIASCIGNILPRIFKKFHMNEAKKREVLSATVAAGMSVAFGAPLAGVLFSLEEASTYFSQKTLWRSFFCSIVATFTFQLMNPFRTGQLILFETTYDRDWHAWEVFCFAFIGLLGGLYGSAFIRLNKRMALLRQTHPFWTGKKVLWKDWVRWVPPTVEWVKRKLRIILACAQITIPTYLNANEPIVEENRPLSAEAAAAAFSITNRRWWKPPRSILHRCFQEILVVSLITSVLSYGNSFLREDMSSLLAGLLKECPLDTNNPSHISLNNTFIPSATHGPELPIGIGNIVQKFTSPLSFTPDHGAIGEDEDFFGLCYQSSNGAFTVTGLLSALILSAAIRMVLCVISFGLRVPGGVYLPSMVIGACVGRSVGLIVRALVQNAAPFETGSATLVTPGTYALVGSAAFLGGITKLTVTIVVMMFEITGGGALTYIVPLMIALMTAKIVRDIIDKGLFLGSITDMYIRLHGYPLLDLKNEMNFFRFRKLEPVEGGSSTNSGEEVTICETILVREVMASVSDLVVIPIFNPEVIETKNRFRDYTPYPHTMGSLRQLLDDTSYQGYPLVENLDSMQLVGFIRRSDLSWVIERARRVYDLENDVPCIFFSESYPVRFQDDIATKLQSHQHATNAQSVLLEISDTESIQNSKEDRILNRLLRPFKNNLQVDLFDPDGQFRQYINFSYWTDSNPITISPHYPMDMVLELFEKVGLRYILIVSEGYPSVVIETASSKIEPGSLLGLITKKDVLRALTNLEMEGQPGEGTEGRSRGISTSSFILSHGTLAN